MTPNTSTKYDLEKFDGSNDFSLWRMKMRAVLIQQGLLKALKGKQRLPDRMSDVEKEDMLERAQSALLLDWFVIYHSFDGDKVLMGNDVACKVVGIGSIHIRMHDGIVRTLTSVRHVPKLRKILISLGTLDSNGCSYRASCGVMRIMKGALIVMKGLKQHSLYLLQGSTVTEATATTSSSDIDFDTAKLWHMRLEHMRERGMDVLSKQGLLGSKKIGKLDFCEHCVFGKQCKVKFNRAVHTTKDEDDGSHSTEENKEPQEQQYNIARNRPRREIRPPQKIMSYNPPLNLLAFTLLVDPSRIHSNSTRSPLAKIPISFQPPKRTSTLMIYTPQAPKF
ncbi:hypothetical protein RJ640_015134 [Escallonia rubra]|uniref:GAG-pre-integrase domain-containing protein n=1 Tax=Escallonia rubra TaxID=112253 RepID=A0AA88U4D4_9ASTE|nr:hypothetical protein RJ640_015134 [Escallonia rubra]